VSAEAALILAAVALYLADCVVLLERGQALSSRAGLAFGSLHYQVRGRAVALLNPFTPYRPVFRTQPLFSGPSGMDAETAARALSPLALLALLQLLLVLVALPACLLRAPGWPLLSALAVAYANAVALLGLLWWRFRRARIAAPLAALGFGWLACLPLSVNALRKAGLAFEVAMDARAAIGKLPSGLQEDARHRLAAQVSEILQGMDEGDADYRRLADLREQLR
jgi:hypothetical protein